MHPFIQNPTIIRITHYECREAPGRSASVPPLRSSIYAGIIGTSPGSRFLKTRHRSLFIPRISEFLAAAQITEDQKSV